MNPETKNCQNCKQNFTIEPEDFDFYKKIDVPPPTFCPECRLIRRLAWRNERTLCNRTCKLCGKKIISVFGEDAHPNVYCNECWLSDKWDASEFAMEINFTKPFFNQLIELFRKTPVPNLFCSGSNMVNSEYCNMVNELKNCYLLHNANFDERSSYGSTVVHTKDSFDLMLVRQCELCYEVVNCQKCYKTIFSLNCENCSNVYFSKDLKGCSDCFGCVNLRNKNYHIFNEPYTREEYAKKLESLDWGSFANKAKYFAQAQEFWNKFPNKYMHGVQNKDVSGDNVNNSKNAKWCFDVANAEDSKYCSLTANGPIKDTYDFTHYGDNVDLIYDGLQIGEGISNAKFGWCVWTNVKDATYCILTIGSSDVFGCVGSRKKQYCILNKQYSKEEYEKLVPAIIENMKATPYIDEKGRIFEYGEFFPMELSPFAYNESSAQEFFPLSKDGAIAKGYVWKGPEKRNYTATITADNIPDHIRDVKETISSDVVECEHNQKCNEQCTQAFRIIKDELAFYRKMNVPFPRLCPNCRHYQRLKQRNPLKLWRRSCMCNGKESSNAIYRNVVLHEHGDNTCPNEFETSYSPDRQEIVYCETCYNSEVA